MTRVKPARRQRKGSATSDVLGEPPRKPRINPKWRGYYERLTALREQLLHRRDGLAQDALEEQPTFSTHMADAGTDTYDRDFALSILSSEQDSLYEIDHALERIRDGTYGTCELTGKKIEAERLEAIPWACFTTEAEQELEK